MRLKKRVKEVIVTCLKALVAGGVLLYLGWSLTLADAAHDNRVCKGVRIAINDPNRMHLLSERDVRDVVESEESNPVNKPFGRINIGQIEERVACNALVREVNCYRLTSGELSVDISLRQPYLRIASPDGGFYIDREMYKIPLTEGWTMPLPVITGTTDTQKIRELTPLVEYIGKHKFWLSTIQQIHVLPSGEVEFVPAEGDFIIRFGRIDRFDQKFELLNIFYNKILPIAGLGRYKRVDVRFNNQIIALNRETPKGEQIMPENDGNN